MFDETHIIISGSSTGSSSRSTGFCFAKLKQRGEEAGQFNQILEGNHGS